MLLLWYLMIFLTMIISVYTKALKIYMNGVLILIILTVFLGRKKMYVEMTTDIKAQSNQTSRKLVKINRFQK